MNTAYPLKVKPATRPVFAGVHTRPSLITIEAWIASQIALAELLPLIEGPRSVAGNEKSAMG